MKDNALFQDFTRVAGREWLDRIRADLRGRSLEDVSWEYAPGHTTSPFVHRDDIGEFVSTIPFTAQWEACEEFTTGDPVETNEQIVTALEGGCEAIVLSLSSLPDWEQLLKGVHAGLIHTTLVPGDSLGAEELHAGFAEFAVRKDFDPPAQWNVRTGRPASVGVRAISLPSGHDVITGLAEAMLAATVEDSRPVQFICNVSIAYFTEIARLRALRILYHNLQKIPGQVSKQVSVEARCAIKVPEENPYQGMIQYGIAALAAICGGADRLVIHPSEAGQTPILHRVARNVHHILRYECKLEDIRDPVQGAYFIEWLTRDMVHKAWETLIRMLEKDGR